MAIENDNPLESEVSQETVKEPTNQNDEVQVELPNTEPETEVVKEEKSADEKVDADDKKEEKEIGFSDFLKNRGVILDESLVEPKKVDLKTKKQQEVASRVLNDIDEVDRELFKAMSNTTFNKLKPIYLEHKQLKQENETLKESRKKEVSTVYGHPKAFLLTKEYQQHENDYNLSERIRTHWALQAAKVSRGEKWQDLDMDPKTGNLVLSEPKESNAEAETFIGDQLQFAREQNFEAKKSIKNYIDNFGKTYETDLAVVNAAKEKYFPGYSAKDHSTRKIQDAVMEALPLSFRNHPVSELLAMTAANNAILMGRLQKALAEIDKIKGIKKDTNNAQPLKGEFTGGKTNDSGVKFSDFKKRRQE